MVQVDSSAVLTWRVRKARSPVLMEPSDGVCVPRYPDRYASVLVIVPAYNEESNIAYVIKGIQQAVPFADILIVNDGSLDATAEVARICGAGVLDLPFNLGIGGAVQAGFKFARTHGYPFVVRIDGDGQHNPDDILRLLGVVMQGEANIAVGSRFRPGQETYCPPFARRLGIRYFSWLVSLMLGCRVYDTTSGFQCMDRQAIQYFARYYPQDYPEVEAHVLIKKAGLKVAEVDATMRPRRSGTSSISYLRSVYYVFKVTLATLIAVLRAVPCLRSRCEELSHVCALAHIGGVSQLAPVGDHSGAGP